jgi:hypothetical protein
MGQISSKVEDCERIRRIITLEAKFEQSFASV